MHRIFLRNRKPTTTSKLAKFRNFQSVKEIMQAHQEEPNAIDIQASHIGPWKRKISLLQGVLAKIINNFHL